MPATKQLRPLHPSDGVALGDLYAATPDDGRFGIAPKYNTDPYLVAVFSEENSKGVLAEKDAQPVGAGFVSLSEANFFRDRQPYAKLHSLAVHPDFRRQGIATQITEWRLRCAKEQLGQGGTILAVIQTGNEASWANAAKWQLGELGTFTTSLTKVRQRPPKPLAGIEIRLAEASDLEQIAAGCNHFYQEYDLYKPQTAKFLVDWLAQTPDQKPFRYLYVAVDRQGNIRASLALSTQWRLMAMQVHHLPTPVRLLNHWVKMVPGDGIMRQLSTRWLWFADGQLPAAQYLWETVRWYAQAFGTHLVISHDPDCPTAAVYALPRWLPKSTMTVVSNRQPVTTGRLLFPL
jgi:GNAT superfamily N-acetyltransferase